MNTKLSYLSLAICVFSALTAPVCAAEEVFRSEIEAGILALVKPPRAIGLEVKLPAGNAARRLLGKYLQDENSWVHYKNRLNSFVPYNRLKPEYQRQVLLSVFRYDYVDDRGWIHRVIGKDETLWSLCEWLTGDGNTYRKVLDVPGNRGLGESLVIGQEVLIPIDLLREPMRMPTPRRVRDPEPELADLMLTQLTEGLRYEQRRRDRYAVYRLKKGETLYTSVAVRFTDFRDHAAISDAVDIIAKASGIRDVRDIDVGEEILIPLEILSDRYQPEGTPARQAYEASLRDAQRLRRSREAIPTESDIVLILDPGHGGRDHGASHKPSGLYEDEINYDIMCRIMALLERDPRFRVYPTMRDRSSGFTPLENTRFSHDTDEELITSPPYPNDLDSTVSANLRWMLVNSIYRKELNYGVANENIVFATIHTDFLFNDKIRGAMVYIPGAKHRRARETRNGAVYAKYAEGRDFNRFEGTTDEFRRDEALSRNFANTLIDELGKKRIKRHDKGDPLRTVIRRDRHSAWLPAVLRNNDVPTKVLVETANLTNPTDRKWLADPWWRQQFALAFVDALRAHFSLDERTLLAATD